MKKPFFGDWRGNNRLQYGCPAALTLPQGSGPCLDIGCGSGESRLALEALGYMWVGLDILHSPGLSVVGDACQLPFRSGSFEAVYMNQSLEHFADPWQAVSEVHRVLKQGGVFAGSASFLEPFHNNYFHFTHWGIERILEVSGFSVLTIEPGTSVFLTLTRRLIGTRRERLALLISQGILRPLVLLLLAAAKATERPQWGMANSGAQVSLGQRAPLTLAGHIRWLARKPSPEDGGNAA